MDAAASNSNNFVLTQRGRECLVHEGFVYTFDRSNVGGHIKFWRCQAKNVNCKSRLHTRDGQVIKVMNSHNHESVPVGFKMRNVRKKGKPKRRQGGEGVDEKRCCVIDPLFAAQEDTTQTGETSSESSSLTTVTPTEDTTNHTHDQNSKPLPLPPLHLATDDEFDIVGKNVAAKLRHLAPTQRIFAERLINETLFEAQLGTLTRDCTLKTKATVKNSASVVQVTYEEEETEEQHLNAVDLKPFL